MAVNTLPFKINFRTSENKKARIYISGPRISDGTVIVPETQTYYEFPNSLAFLEDIKITAVEVDTNTNPSTLKANATNEFTLKSVYDSQTDVENLYITTKLGTLTPATEVKQISTNRNCELYFMFPFSENAFNFSGLENIGPITPIINLNGTNTTTDTGLFNTGGTINIDFGGIYGQNAVPGGTDFTTTNLEYFTQNLPSISNPSVTNITEKSAKITFNTNTPAASQIIFTGGLCPKNPTTGEIKCETSITPTNYKTIQYNSLPTEHTFDIFNLEPNKQYSVTIRCKIPIPNPAAATTSGQIIPASNTAFYTTYQGNIIQRNGVTYTWVNNQYQVPSQTQTQTTSTLEDYVFEYPNVVFTTYEAPTITQESDALPFEIAFAGNFKDDVDMYFDEAKEKPRVSLKFDYNQPLQQQFIDKGRRVNITEPILDEEIELFNNTDALVTSKKFLSEGTKIDLGFVLNEQFKNDLEDKPLFIRDQLYYTLDIADTDIADGDFAIDPSDIATEEYPNRKWKKINVDNSNGFVIPAQELLKLETGELGNRLLIVALYKKRNQYTPLINIPDKDGLIFEVPFSEKDLDRTIEIPYNQFKFANAVQVYLDSSTTPIATLPLIEQEGIISLSYKLDFGLLPGKKIIQISPILVENNQVVSRGESTSFNIEIVAVDDFPNLLYIKKPTKIRIPPYKTYDTKYVLELGATPETSYVDVEILIPGFASSGEVKNRREKLQRLVPLPKNTQEKRYVIDDRSFSYVVYVPSTSELEEGMEVQSVSGKLPPGTKIETIAGPTLLFLSVIPTESLEGDTLIFKPLDSTVVKFKYEFNIQDKIQKVYPDWNNKFVNLVLTPYSNKKIADPLFSNLNDIKGLEYPISTSIEKSDISISLQQIKSLLLDMLISSADIKSPKENKYISHLANFGDDKQILISSWENDNYTLSTKEKDEAGNEKVIEEVKSIILKLYKPLPEEIIPNSTLWITKLLANPIIETVILREDIKSSCPPLRGPNFKIPVDYVTGQSTNFESLDTLIISSSVSSSATLIQEYLSKGAIDTTELNIQYVSGSISDSTATYAFENFVHFSSAKERLDNFVYKVQLIELYENAISASQYDPNNTGYPNSFTIKQDIELQTDKKNKIIGGFDGFEKFLYNYSSEYTTNSTTSMTWPYSGGVRLASTSTTVINWYNNFTTLAQQFDTENKNALLNNIPSYILNNEENDQFMLFIAMIGQHFDIIYFFNKAIERSRGSNYSSVNGIANKLLYEKLKSFNWDAKNLAANSKLWEYTLGLDINGNIKENSPAKQRNSEIWRRILNNLPYLLKHKGTKRAVHALLACYGIPSSNLSILEFGGPEISETTKSKHLIENISTALKFENTSKVTTLWTNTNKSRKPDTVEIFVKPAYASNWTIVSGSGWSLTASGSASSKYGRVFFKIGSTNYLSSSVLPLFNGQFFGIELAATTGSPNYVFELNVAQNKQERVIFSSSTTASVAAATSAPWQTAGYVAIGSGYSGSVDEFRLWSTKLDKDRFYEHVAFPEMVNGNHVSSSTEDLFFRLDFDYPKNVSTYTTTPNVDNNTYYPQGTTRNKVETNTIIVGSNIFSESSPAIYSASFSGFTSVASYPYQFEVIERSSVLEIPDLGIQRYSNNKIRFEEQSLDGNVLYKDVRNTIRAYDNAPMDSNKLGLFFSPTKELNIDIAKSLGGINLDDYIGDPRDQFKDRYSSLDRIRQYYFNRFDGRDIYAYINLVKLYEQNLFEDIKQLLPARSKVTTGILIEPHILERSKIARKKPSGENNQYETTIDYNLQENISAESTQYETTITNTDTTNLSGEATQYEGTIDTINEFFQSAEATQYEGTISTDTLFIPIGEATQYEGDVDTRSNTASVQAYIDWLTSTIGESDLENYGLGLFMQKPGIAVRSYIDKYGVSRKERVRVNIITRQYTKFFQKYKVKLPNGLGDPRGGTEVTSSLATERLLTIQPFTGTTAPTIGGEIIQVEQVSGYLPTHYKYTQDNSTGLQNSFYNGCKLTGIVPIDGKPVVEEFISNPGTLTVNKFGRNSNEPILEVE